MTLTRRTAVGATVAAGLLSVLPVTQAASFVPHPHRGGCHSSLPYAAGRGG